MNPAQLLNPKAFAKEKAKAAKRTPNYGMFTISLSSFTCDNLAIRYFRLVLVIISLARECVGVPFRYRTGASSACECADT
jgi:hypothetical protein